MTRPPAAADALPGDTVQTAAIRHTQIRMLFSHVPVASGVAVGFAMVIAWLMLPAAGTAKTLGWLALKCLIIVPRVWQTLAYFRARDRSEPRWYRDFLVLMVIDAFIWSMAGWWLAPAGRLELAAVALGSLLGLAAVGAFMLSTDLRATVCFLVPLLLPNALYCLTRPDAFGLFGALCVPGFALILMLEARRSQRRIVELLRLRYSTEQVAREGEQARLLAERHSAAKSRFLAAMSHEMRTPLHGMLGLARLLREDETRPPALQRLGLLERSGEHLLTVINDVLDFSKIESGHLKVDPRAFDLAPLVDDVAGMARVDAARKGLMLELQGTLPRPCPAYGDPSRLRQVLHNLLGNAIKFTDRGHVRLHIRMADEPWAMTGSMWFEVEDTGIGIPEDELPRIFDAFHQVEGDLERHHEGAGLGLTISRELCRAMGARGDGELHGRSQAGAGSVFRFCIPLELGLTTLPPPAAGEAVPAHALAHQEPPALTPLTPVSPPAAEPAPAACAAPATSNGLPSLSGRILLVEDNPVNAMVAEATLQQYGLEVATVHDGQAAVDWLAAERADLVLMDCQMPVLDGLEATRRVREHERHTGRQRVPIVALTANAYPEERARCLGAGMDDHLAKPFRLEELTEVLLRRLPGVLA